MPERKIEPPKVMDIAHPSHVRASASSRPLIVTNRPMIAEDPMIAQVPNTAAEAAQKTEPEASAPTSAPALSTHEKHIQPPHTEELTVGAGSADAIDTPHEPGTVDTSVDASDEHDNNLTEKDDTPEMKSSQNDSEQGTIVLSSEDVSDTSSDVVEHSPLLAAADEQKQIEAADAREQRIEELIDKGTYAVPISGAHIGGGGKAAAVLIITIILGAILLNLALDMGFVRLSHIPHTTFFSIP